MFHRGSVPYRGGVRYIDKCIHNKTITSRTNSTLICFCFLVKNDIEEISRLVSLGVDVNAPNSDGNCAIHVASKLGSRAVVQYLIDQRAEINTIDSSGNAPLNVRENFSLCRTDLEEVRSFLTHFL